VNRGKGERPAFRQVSESRIFEPLGMNHTTLSPDPKDHRVATGSTTFALSAAEAASPEADGWARAAGALYSTTSWGHWGHVSNMILLCNPSFFGDG